MGKGKDAKKSVKKESLLTPKEKKAAKKAKKAGYLSQWVQAFYASFIDKFQRTYKKGIGHLFGSVPFFMFNTDSNTR